MNIYLFPYFPLNLYLSLNLNCPGTYLIIF